MKNSICVFHGSPMQILQFNMCDSSSVSTCRMNYRLGGLHGGDIGRMSRLLKYLLFGNWPDCFKKKNEDKCHKRKHFGIPFI